MGTYFGNQQATGPKAWYERLIYTAGPIASLAAGVTPIFNAANWNVAGNPMWQARLEMLQAAQNVGVLAQWTADPQNQVNALGQGNTSAMPAGLRQLPLNVNAVQTLGLALSNQSGAAVANYSLNYAVAMKRLTAADKLLAQQAGLTGYSLTAQEKQALTDLNVLDKQGNVTATGIQQLQDLTVKGTLPHSLERIMQALWQNREVYGPADMYSLTSSAADNLFATYSAHLDAGDVTKGRFPVLTGIAIEGGSALNAVLSVDRDGQLSYMEMSALGFAQTDDSEWECFVPATDYLAFHIINGPGQVADLTVPIRLRVAELAMSEVLAIQLGRITHPSQVGHPRTYNKVIAGLG